MASLIDSMRASLGDQWWFVKLMCSTYILYFTIFQAQQYFPNQAMLFVFYIIAGLFFVGSASVTINRNMNNKYPLFPGLSSILEVFLSGLGGILSIALGVLLGFIFVFVFDNYLVPAIQIEESFIKYIFWGLGILFAIPFAIIPLMLYSTNYDIRDIVRFDIISKYAGDIFIGLLSFLIQYIVICVIGYVAVSFFLLQMLGSDNIFLNVWTCAFIVISFFTMIVYFSELAEGDGK